MIVRASDPPTVFIPFLFEDRLIVFLFSKGYVSLSQVVRRTRNKLAPWENSCSSSGAVLLAPDGGSVSHVSWRTWTAAEQVPSGMSFLLLPLPTLSLSLCLPVFLPWGPLHLLSSELGFGASRKAGAQQKNGWWDKWAFSSSLVCFCGNPQVHALLLGACVSTRFPGPPCQAHHGEGLARALASDPPGVGAGGAHLHPPVVCL